MTLRSCKSTFLFIVLSFGTKANAYPVFFPKAVLLKRYFFLWGPGSKFQPSLFVLIALQGQITGFPSSPFGLLGHDRVPSQNPQILIRTAFHDFATVSHY